MDMVQLYLESAMNDKDKMKALVARFPHLVQSGGSFYSWLIIWLFIA